jgi:hypothetical protein
MPDLISSVDWMCSVGSRDQRAKEMRYETPSHDDRICRGNRFADRLWYSLCAKYRRQCQSSGAGDNNRPGT